MTVGCVNGRLEGVKAYVFAVLGVKEGDPARDWVHKLTTCGIPAGLGPGQKPGPNAPHFGLTQQIGASGDVRGRLFLPTETPDELGYYTHPVDLVPGYPDNPTWGWIDRGGPPYAPRPCENASEPPHPPSEPPNTPPVPTPIDLGPVLNAIADFRMEQTTGMSMIGQKIDMTTARVAVVDAKIDGLAFAGTGSMRIPFLGTVTFSLTLTRLP